MKSIDAIILGIVQGLTEFLPVSSSGHLVLVQNLLQVASEDLSVSVVAHFGTLLAVLFFYRREFRTILIGMLDRKISLFVNPSWRLFILVLVATLPAAVVGFVFEDFFKSLFVSPKWVGGFFLLTAIIIWLSRYRAQDHDYSESFVKNLAHQMSFSQAFLIGISQALAICPGLSRSGTTITTALYVGLNREQASFFSFLISVPVILGALLFQLPEVLSASSQGTGGGTMTSLMSLFIVWLTSLVFGLIGLLAVTRILNRGGLYLFAFYLLPLGLFVFFKG